MGKHLGIRWIVPLVLLCTANPILAEQNIEWKVQLSFGGIYEEFALDFAKNVNALTDSSLKLTLYPPGDLVGASECFDAVSTNLIDACWSMPFITANTIPAALFFAVAPFTVSDAAGTMSWIVHGGGAKLRDELYARHGVSALSVNYKPTETSGWFRQPVDTVDDFKGMKMRFFGIGAKVLQKLGVEVQDVKWTEIKAALKSGDIDGMEAAAPHVDFLNEFHESAKYVYMPGWHNAQFFDELLVNKKRFDALSETQREALEIAAKASIIDGIARYEYLDAIALDSLINDHGVIVKQWSESQLAALEKAWREVLAEEAANDADFRRVADSYFAWNENYGRWLDVIRPKPTYLK